MEVVGHDAFWNLYKIAFDKQKYPIFARDMVSLFENFTVYKFSS
jgi:hypothetical protein